MTPGTAPDTFMDKVRPGIRSPFLQQRHWEMNLSEMTGRIRRVTWPWLTHYLTRKYLAPVPMQIVPMFPSAASPGSLTERV